MKTKKEIALFFGCTAQQLTNQYAANTKTLQVMHDKAVRTGKRVNGYTADQLAQMIRNTIARR